MQPEVWHAQSTLSTVVRDGVKSSTLVCPGNGKRPVALCRSAGFAARRVPQQLRNSPCRPCAWLLLGLGWVCLCCSCCWVSPFSSGPRCISGNLQSMHSQVSEVQEQLFSPRQKPSMFSCTFKTRCEAGLCCSIRHRPVLPRSLWVVLVLSTWLSAGTVLGHVEERRVSVNLLQSSKRQYFVL